MLPIPKDLLYLNKKVTNTFNRYRRALLKKEFMRPYETIEYLQRVGKNTGEEIFRIKWFWRRLGAA